MSHGIGPVMSRTNDRIAALQVQLSQDVAALGGDLWLIRYGIKQAAIDPAGYLRLKRHANEAETLETAVLYAVIHGRYARYISALRKISSTLARDQRYRAFIEVSVQASCAIEPDMTVSQMRWCFAHSYVLGRFASEYPAELFQRFPSVKRTYDAVYAPHDPDQTPMVLAMQIAMVDLLMVPNRAGMDHLVQMN